MSDYPELYTTAEGLFNAKDFSRTVLEEDLVVVPTSILVSSTNTFPDTGIITITNRPGALTSDRAEDWACSFSYQEKTDGSFEGLILVKGNFLPKYKEDPVTLNVISDHHTSLADEILNLQTVLGHRETNVSGTLVRRIGNLESKTRTPRAFLACDKPSGFAPHQVTFTDLSTRAPGKWIWSFGDDTTSFAQYPIHTYSTSGIYTVRLTVFNDYGTDEFEAKELIKVLEVPPDKPTIEANPRKLIVGERAQVVAVNRDHSPRNQFNQWDWEIPEGTGSITSPNGVVSDGLPEGIYRTYSPAISLDFLQGGFFDLGVIARNYYNGYVGTKEDDIIEVTEQTNCWDLRTDGITVRVLEMGVTSKAFKERAVPPLDIGPEILDSFDRNWLPSSSPFTGCFLRRNSIGEIHLDEYDGFLEKWSSIPAAKRDWLPNFASFKAGNKIYLMFGRTATGQISTGAASFDLTNRQAWTTLESPSGMPSTGMDVYTAQEKGGFVYILGRAQGDTFATFLKYDPAVNIITTLTPPSALPGVGPTGMGADVHTRYGKLVTLDSGLFLFGPVGSVAAYLPDADSWLSSDESNMFALNIRVSADGAGDTAFIENHGSRYVAYFTKTGSSANSIEGVFTTQSIPKPSYDPIEKGVF